MSLLTEIKKRLGQLTADEIGTKLHEVREQRRAFAREHRLFPEDVHVGIDARRAEARSLLEQTLAGRSVLDLARIPVVPRPGQGLELSHRGVAALVTLVEDDGYWTRLHAAVDAAPKGSFSTLAKPAFEKKLAEYGEQVRDLELELERREVEAAKRAADEAERELAAKAEGKK